MEAVSWLGRTLHNSEDRPSKSLLTWLQECEQDPTKAIQDTVSRLADRTDFGSAQAVTINFRRQLGIKLFYKYAFMRNRFFLCENLFRIV